MTFQQVAPLLAVLGVGPWSEALALALARSAASSEEATRASRPTSELRNEVEQERQ